MSCKDVQQNIEAYLDGELTLSDRRDFEEHLSGCAQCKTRLEGLSALNQSVRQVGYVSKPASLRRNIRSGLRDITGEDSPAFGWSHLLGVGGASAVAASFAVWATLSLLPGMSMQSAGTDEVISAHVRSMMVDHVTDVTSSDKHTVKPWFNGKLDFSPTVLDLKDEGFPLIGGRLEYLQQQPTAALVYHRRAHVINLFIRRDGEPSQATPATLTRQQGYQVINWQQQGLGYTLVSDLNAAELQEFARLLGNDKR